MIKFVSSGSRWRPLCWIALLAPTGSVSSLQLGGNPECWAAAEPWLSYETCCETSFWGKSGNLQCFGPDRLPKWCCESLRGYSTSKDPCHTIQLRESDTSGWLISRALEIMSCLWRTKGADALPEVLGYLNISARRADEMRNPYRAVSLVAMEWQRLTGESPRRAALRVLEYVVPHAQGSQVRSALQRRLRRAAALLRPRRTGPSEEGRNDGVPAVSGGPCCDVLRHSGLGDFACMMNETGGFGERCGWSPEGAALRERALAIPRAHLAPIRGAWSPWGFDGTTRAGRVLHALCKRPEVTTVLDLFTSTGTGATLTAAHALHGKGKLITVEILPKHFHEAKFAYEPYADSVSAILGDGREVIPRVCQEEALDLILIDMPIFFGEFWESFENCRPRWWLITNVQVYYAWRPTEVLLNNNYELVLHDFSPTLIGRGLLGSLQEFVVLRRTEPSFVSAV